MLMIAWGVAGGNVQGPSKTTESVGHVASKDKFESINGSGNGQFRKKLRVKHTFTPYVCRLALLPATVTGMNSRRHCGPIPTPGTTRFHSNAKHNKCIKRRRGK